MVDAARPDAPAFTPAPIRFRVWDGETMHCPDDADLLCGDGEVWSAFRDQSEPGSVPLLSTGLRDADGREVFEGDLVTTWGDPATVHRAKDLGRVQRGTYQDGDDGKTRHGWHVWDLPGGDLLGESCWALSPDFMRDSRVVGNVYEGVREPA